MVVLDDDFIELVGVGVERPGTGEQRRTLTVARVADSHAADLEHRIAAVGFGLVGAGISRPVLHGPTPVEGLLAADADGQDLLLLVAVLQLLLQPGILPGREAIAAFDRIAPVELELVAGSILLVGEGTEQCAQVPASIAVRSIVEVRGQPQAFPVHHVVALFDLFRPLELDVVGSLEVAEPAAVGLDVLRAEVAVEPRHRSRHAKALGAVAEVERVGIGHRDLRAGLFLKTVETGLGGHAETASGRVETRGALDVHGTADPIAVHVGRDGLAHLQRGQEFGRYDVERNRPLVVLRRRDVDAVDRGHDEIRVDTANAHEPSFALVAFEKHAGYALQGFGDVLIGKLADVGGGDDGHDAVRRPLLVEGGRRALRLLAVDNDFFGKTRQGKSVARRCAVPDVDLDTARRIADVAHRHFVTTCRYAAEYETPVGRGHRFELDLGYADDRPFEETTVAGDVPLDPSVGPRRGRG